MSKQLVLKLTYARWRKIIALYLVSFLLCIANVSQANVNIQINQTQYSYLTQPRLNEILTPIEAAANWYWPSAQLFNLDKTAVEEQRQALISLLSNYAKQNDDSRATYAALIQQLQNWRLADRIQIKIDFELTRFSLEHNPRFEDGDYLLKLSTRPKNLYIFGAIDAPIVKTFSENSCLQDLLTDVNRLANADLNQVYLISPSGSVQSVPIAYWNSRCVVAMPGSSIYVPLQENQWFKQAKVINRQVASLAINRIHAQ
jgi:hypothetical protein